MTTDYENLIDVLKLLFHEILEKKREYKRGLLGDGAGNINVPNRQDYVYVREDKFSSKIWQVFNKRVDGVEGMPVLVGELAWQPGLIQVVAVDWAAYETMEWGDTFIGTPAHAQSHQYDTEANPGNDKVLVFQPALQQLKPTGDGTLIVTIQPLTYMYSNVYKSFLGGIADITSSVPSTASKAIYILIALNTVTNGLVIVEGTEVADSPSVSVPKPGIPSEYIPSCYIKLVTGQSTITTADNIEDARSFLLPPPNDFDASGNFGPYTPITDDAGWVVDELTGTLIVGHEV